MADSSKSKKPPAPSSVTIPSSATVVNVNNANPAVASSPTVCNADLESVPASQTVSDSAFASKPSSATMPMSSATSFAFATGITLSAEEMEGQQGPGQEPPPVGQEENFGKYQMLQEIGRGGMGRVELWKDQHIQRLVATKLLLPQTKGGPETAQRFMEEGQITGQLEHPNIVPIHELGVDQAGNLYFTMKYVKGKSLKALLEHILADRQLHSDWSQTKILQIFQNICYALEYAHAKKVIHRDLKPDNVMLGNFGEVLVMDWGLAKVVGQGHEILSDDTVTTLRTEGGFKTIAGKIAGTPLYMAPEQAAGNVNEIDERSDIYALGAILYEMLTGTNAVDPKGSVTSILLNVMEGHLREVPKTGLWGNIPRELRCIVKKTLAHQRDDRYQTVQELAEDVQKFLDGREVSVCRYTWQDRLVRIAKQYRKEIGLVASTLVLAVTAFLVWDYRHANRLALIQLEEGDKLLVCPTIAQSFQTFREAKGELNPYEARRKWEEARKSFEHVKSRVFGALGCYTKAYEIRSDNRFKESQAQAWLTLFEAATFLDDTSWTKAAREQIKKLVSPASYAQSYQQKLDCFADFSVTTDPPGASVYLYKFMEMRNHWWRMAPLPYDLAKQSTKVGMEDWQNQQDQSRQIKIQWEATEDPDALLGKSPLPKTQLAEGSYLVVCTLPGHIPVRSVIGISHLSKNSGMNTFDLQLRLPLIGNCPSGFVYVPKTKFIAGGEAVGAMGSRWEEAGPVYLQKQEVTFGDYHTFLTQIVQQGTTTFLQKILAQKRKYQPSWTIPEAQEFVKLLIDKRRIAENPELAHAWNQLLSSPPVWAAFLQGQELPLPTLMPLHLNPLHLMPRISSDLRIFQYSKEGHAVQVNPAWSKDKPTWKAWPVGGLTKIASDAYALWQGVQLGRQVRLPTELEWELAARGADGRLFSWGNIFSKKAAKLNAGYGMTDDVNPNDEVMRATGDISPFGVHDLAGSLGEWTSSVFYGDPAGHTTYTIKGNIWGLAPEGAKCMFRVGEIIFYTHPTLGFRLAVADE